MRQFQLFVLWFVSKYYGLFLLSISPYFQIVVVVLLARLGIIHGIICSNSQFANGKTNLKCFFFYFFIQVMVPEAFAIVMAPTDTSRCVTLKLQFLTVTNLGGGTNNACYIRNEISGALRPFYSLHRAILFLAL